MVISGRKCSTHRGGGRGGGSLKGCDGAAAGSTSGHNWSPTLNKSINNVVTQNTYWEERREGERGGGTSQLEREKWSGPVVRAPFQLCDSEHAAASDSSALFCKLCSLHLQP